MQYRHFEAGNYEDFASGRVIVHRAGFPNFPVRLAGEIFMQCLEIAGKDSAVLYDPCCGGAYVLTVLGLLCGEHVEAIYASDISAEAVALAQANLNLLTPRGLDNRRAQLAGLYEQFGKQSHFDALKSVGRLEELLLRRDTPIPCAAFQADIMDETALSAANFKADIVFVDAPYGNLAHWSQDGPHALDKLLCAVRPVLADGAVAALCSDKSQKIQGGQFKRVRKILVGKRKIELLQKVT